MKSEVWQLLAPFKKRGGCPFWFSFFGVWGCLHLLTPFFVYTYDMVRKIFSWLLSVVFPARCVGCSRAGEILCAVCKAQVRLQKRHYCQMGEDGTYRMPTREMPLMGLWAPCTYGGQRVLQRAIQGLKYKYYEELAEYLGGLLAKSMGQIQNVDHYIVVPVPLHTRRLRERGWNQAELLARAAVAVLPYKPKIVQMLVRTRYTKPQAKLSRRERLTNVVGAFALKKGSVVQGRRILLVDDVAATGATLQECARVLMRAGAGEVIGVVVGWG